MLSKMNQNTVRSIQRGGFHRLAIALQSGKQTGLIAIIQVVQVQVL
jgi:hypothetical protein